MRRKGRWIGAILGVLVVFTVVPSVLRSRIKGGEAPVIGDLRTILSGQEAYASFNGGFYDSPACLAQPWACLPGYTTVQPFFLDARTASLDTRDGYVRPFHPGPKAPPEAIAKGGISASSLTAFACVATPTTSGPRAFCIDSTGHICNRKDGTMPEPKGGRCPGDCETLQ